MSYFIIIRGPLGVGKSAISKKLAEILHAEYISIDKILEQYQLDPADPNQESIPLSSYIKAQEIVLPIAQGALEREQIVIFDSCFYFKEEIEQLIQTLPYDHYVFTLKAPLDVCIDRDSKRDKVYGKEAAEAVHNMVSRFDYGNVIDVNRNIDFVVEEILSIIPKKI
ncbi:MAG: AAA family ATPase [Candidatus Magasanikbacteria bacterium]|jgi:tRNA uridine 5-carbamoylmethylation protein Kti12